MESWDDSQRTTRWSCVRGRCAWSPRCGRITRRSGRRSARSRTPIPQGAARGTLGLGHRDWPADHRLSARPGAEDHRRPSRGRDDRPSGHAPRPGSPNRHPGDLRHPAFPRLPGLRRPVHSGQLRRHHLAEQAACVRPLPNLVVESEGGINDDALRQFLPHLPDTAANSIQRTVCRSAGGPASCRFFWVWPSRAWSGWF
jgi:hypothetical protein